MKNNSACKPSKPTPTRLTGSAPIRAVEAHIADLEECANKFKDLFQMCLRAREGKGLSPQDTALELFAVAKVSWETARWKIEALNMKIYEMKATDLVELKLTKGLGG